MTKVWRTTLLGDVLEVQNGYAFDSKGFNSSNGLPLIRIRSLKSGTETETRFSGDYDKKYVVKDGDLLIGMDGEFGCYEWKGGPALLNQRVCRLQGFDSQLVPRFVFYGVNSHLKAIEDVTGFTTVKHLSSRQILGIEFTFPPLSEQQRIVGILDEAFERIATAKANCEKNLQNARALFESHLNAVFTQRGQGWVEKQLGEVCELYQGLCINAKTNHLLVEKSSLPLLRIKDLRSNSAEQFIAEEGWPKNAKVSESDIIYTRTGQIGLVFRGRSGVLHNNCFKVTPSTKLNGDYLYWWLQNPDFKVRITELASKAAQPDITHALFKVQMISLPPRDYQDQVIELIDEMREETRRLESLYQRKLIALDELKKSLLHQAFSGQLTAKPESAVVIPFPNKIFGITTTDLHAGILAMAHKLHEQKGNPKHFGHVKAEKIAHMAEAWLGIDLEREPIKDAAGPNDYPHQMKVEHRARMAGYFDFQRVKDAGYQVTKFKKFDSLIDRTRERLGDRVKHVDALLELMLPMNTQQAEIFCTVYAAWNNLLLDGQQPSDEAIVFESRENWHEAKLKIPREKFFAAIGWLKEHNIMPRGRGRKVLAKGKKK